MKNFLTIILTFAFHAPLGFMNAFSARPALFLANLGETTNIGSRSYKNDAVISTRHLLYKKGTDAEHVAVCGAADEPLGTVPDEADVIETDVEVCLLGIHPATRIMLGTAAMTAGADAYTDASGKIQGTPTVAGVYWLLGRVLTAESATPYRCEVQHHKPIKVVVLAAPTQTATGTIAALNSTAVNPTKADFDALLAEAGKLQNDYYLLRTAMSTPALLQKL